MSRSDEREEILEIFSDANVSDRNLTELADEAEDLLAAGREPEEAVERVLRRRAVERKRARGSYAI